MARKSRQWEDALAKSKRVRLKDISRRGVHGWIREAWTWHVQHNYSEKVLVIERLRSLGVTGERGFAGGAQVDDIEYRFGYFIVGRHGRVAGRWTWGQYSPLIPHDDLANLLAKARQEGTLLHHER